MTVESYVAQLGRFVLNVTAFSNVIAVRLVSVIAAVTKAIRTILTRTFFHEGLVEDEIS